LVLQRCRRTDLPGWEDVTVAEEEEFGDLSVGDDDGVLFVTFLDEETPEVVLSGD